MFDGNCITRRLRISGISPDLLAAELTTRGRNRITCQNLRGPATQEGLICLISYAGNDGMGWKPYSGFDNHEYELCGCIFWQKNKIKSVLLKDADAGTEPVVWNVSLRGQETV